jgi:hypothetical protein
MELLGRETELASVDRAVQDARGGGARALGLFGEAGIGKSALLGALRERASDAGMLVLEGRAAEHGRSVPFGLVVDALDDYVATLHPRRVESVGPDLAAVLPSAAAARSGGVGGDGPAAGAAERFRYHRAVRALLELLGRERPVALVLDDLHWADEASVELVLHLLRRPPRAPHLLAFALRPQAPAPRLLDAARSAPAWEHVQPRPLTDDAARALVAELPDSALRDRVVREAGGNPLFLEELRRVARDPAEALPPTLMAAVGLEIGALPPSSRALIEGAAVAGDPFDPELAAAAALAAASPSRSTASSPPTSSVPPATGARSRSGIRSSSAPSTTPRRRRGGSPRTSAPPPRSRRAAPGPRRARTTSSATPARAIWRRSTCSPPRPRTPPTPRRRPRRAATPLRCASSRTTRSSSAQACWDRWRSSRPPPDGWRTRATRWTRCCGCSRPSPRRCASG